MGNFLKIFSDRVSVIASARLWLEDAAVQQLLTTAQLPGMQQVVGLPDLHPGRGYPVGAAFFSSGRFYPALVGNDIGCGMRLAQTDIPISKVKLDKLDKQLGNLDGAIDDEEWAVLKNRDAGLQAHINALTQRMAQAGLDLSQLRSLGTIGGGNHFVELQVIDEIRDAAAFECSGLSLKKLQILVHSGSRGLGQEILRTHVDAFGHAGLPDNGADAAHYLAQHDAALDFARLNRAVIALRVASRLHCSAAPVMDIHHNLLTPAQVNGQSGWLHRKGATPSDQGLVMLPGSRGDYSYVLAPIGDGQASLSSLAHGAGRKWARTDCKGRLFKLFSPDNLSRTPMGSRVICNDKALIYEEAPQAYKNVDSVLDCLEGAGLVRAVARSKPVLTYKTRGECC
jgi:release factor H-coupled RctB family protein